MQVKTFILNVNFNVNLKRLLLHCFVLFNAK